MNHQVLAGVWGLLLGGCGVAGWKRGVRAERRWSLMEIRNGEACEAWGGVDYNSLFRHAWVSMVPYRLQSPTFAASQTRRLCCTMLKLAIVQRQRDGTAWDWPG
jgi:hypothetical protein